jgi:8-oxo-dGTP diphosphatase
MTRRATVKVAVDVVLLTIRDTTLHVLLVTRRVPPFEGVAAIPGGFVLADESLDEAAARELREETGVAEVYLEQLYTFGAPARDPRGRVISVAYFALVPDAHRVTAGSDAATAAWCPVGALPPLAFDHGEIVASAVQRLRNKLDYTNVGAGLLPEHFTLRQLQAVHEAVLGSALDKRNFRRKVLQHQLVTALESWQATGRRPAQLFRFTDAPGR